jgi:hypothetical protein
VSATPEEEPVSAEGDINAGVGRSVALAVCRPTIAGPAGGDEGDFTTPWTATLTYVPRSDVASERSMCR